MINDERHIPPDVDRSGVIIYRELVAVSAHVCVCM